TSAPTTDPNAMDLLAFQRGPHNQLSDTKQARQVQLNLCFRFLIQLASALLLTL
ncbi:hypothetical protein VP01_11765g1, partial [Puccinia sorghi]